MIWSDKLEARLTRPGSKQKTFLSNNYFRDFKLTLITDQLILLQQLEFDLTSFEHQILS